MDLKKIITVAALLFVSSSSLISAENTGDSPVPFKEGEKILFLGDSIIRGGGWHSMVSLFYETRFPEKRITWLNAGISGDTAAGALKRLQWDVLDHKPDHVIIMFGINDIDMLKLYDSESPEKLAARQTRIKEYAANMEKLIVALKAAKIKVVVCTASPYDETVKLEKPGYAGANAALTHCAAICKELAAKYALPLVDFNGPMNAMALDFQRTNPTFTLIGGDRVHPGAMGNTIMAYLFLKAQNVPGIISETVIDAASGKLLSAGNATVTDLSAAANEVSFTLLEKSLPLPFEGESREALHLVPFEKDLNRQMLTVAGLVAGEYELLIDEKSVGRWWHDELAAGVNLSGLRTTPQYQQSRQVSEIHSKRHQMASLGPRMIAFTRLYTLMPAGVDIKDEAAVKGVLEKLINDPAAKDNPDLGFGGYGQTMAKKYLECKPKEAETAAAIAAADDEVYKRNSPLPHRYRLKLLEHPVPADKRLAAFNSRRTPEKVEALAKDFLDILILDGPELLRSNLRMRKSLQKVADLAKAGKPLEAIDAYRDYLFEKLRNPAACGLPANLLDPYNGLLNPAEREKTIAKADELLNNKIDANISMPPGTVWLPRGKEGSNGVRNPWTPSTFQPLAAAYLFTGEQRYLDKWIDYMDDWAMHEITDDAIRPTDISDTDSHAVSQVLNVYRVLGGIARMQPAKQADFPADSLARILGKLIRVYPPLSTVYHDSNPQNWTPGATAYLMKAATLMDEFRAAEYLFNRARHRHENYGTIQFLPDGSETEHALWYNCHYYDGASDVLGLADARRSVQSNQRPIWEESMCSVNWESEQRRKLGDRARYFLQMLTPQSQYPVGNRSDQRTLPDWKSASMVEYAIMNGAPDLRVLLNTFRGNTAAGLPDFTMSAFPYSGSWLMRTGWGKDAGYGHFFSSPYPVGGHAFPGLKSNNSFYLSASGQDLLVSGGFGSYSYDRSPLRVDGKEQFAHAGIGNPGVNKNHKGFGVAYVDPLPPVWRSHSSSNFDLAEGIYDGPYGDFIEDHHDNKDYRADFLAERARAAFNGVSHQRQVFFVKDSGFWIVVDRLRSSQSHDYSLDWRLPTAQLGTGDGKRKGKYAGKTFAPEMICADEARQTLITNSAAMPNLAIRHFGPKLAFTTAREDTSIIANDYTGHYSMYDFWRVSGTWKSSGNDMIISLIEVRPADGTSSIVSTEAIGNGKTTRGFKAVTSSGKTVSFMAAVNGSAELTVGDVSVKGEALLVVKGRVRGTSTGEEEESVSGIVLDCKSMSIDRQSVNIPHTDFDFSLNSNSTPDPRTRPSRLAAMPIWNPIQPVRIEPARNVITGVQPVTLTCATAGVELRYTLDGSEPTLHSALYSGPINVNNSVTVKARAFRTGLNRVSASLAGTHASVIAVANYVRQEPLAPFAALDDKRYSPGIKADYFEGDWKDLVFSPEKLKPLKTQKVNQLFERCTPNVDKVFGWTYSGMLSIPEDGVYTFHAPLEMVTSPQEPGYALRMFVGQEMLFNNRPSGRLNEWYPASTRHAYGTWSIALKKGLHPFKAIYVDYRTDAVERLNHPGMRLNTIWDGVVPQLEISGPGLDRQPIPKAWLAN